MSKNCNFVLSPDKYPYRRIKLYKIFPHFAIYHYQSYLIITRRGCEIIMKLKIRKVLLLVCASVFLLLLYNSAKSLDPDTDHRGYSRPIEATSPVPSDIKDVPTCIGNQSRAINQILTSQLMKEISTYETEVSVLSDRSMIVRNRAVIHVFTVIHKALYLCRYF